MIITITVIPPPGGSHLMLDESPTKVSKYLRSLSTTPDDDNTKPTIPKHQPTAPPHRVLNTRPLPIESSTHENNDSNPDVSPSGGPPPHRVLNTRGINPRGLQPRLASQRVH
jgi:hypothetical protein